MEKLRVHLERIPGTLTVKVFFYKKLEHGTYLVGKRKGTNELIETTIPIGQAASVEELDPILEVREDFFREILEAFATEAMGQGIETHNSYIKGKLEAKEEHLADVRKMLGEILPVVLKTRE